MSFFMTGKVHNIYSAKLFYKRIPGPWDAMKTFFQGPGAASSAALYCAPFPAGYVPPVTAARISSVLGMPRL